MLKSVAEDRAGTRTADLSVTRLGEPLINKTRSAKEGGRNAELAKDPSARACFGRGGGGRAHR